MDLAAQPDFARISADEAAAYVRELAEHVWSDTSLAEAFLATPHPMLGNRSPAQLMRTPEGANAVARLLWRLYYGLPA